MAYEAYEAYEDYTSSYSELKLALLRHDYVTSVVSVDLIPRSVLILAELNHSGFLIYRIRYMSDGYEIGGYVSAPADFMENEYPILIANRGGNRNYSPVTPEHIIPLAVRGYIVLSSQLRGTAGGAGMDQFGGDDINDVLRLIDISESFDFASQGGVYMIGASRGGMMTYIASRMDDRIRAAAVWSGVSNLFEAFNERTDGMPAALVEMIGGTPDELPEEYERRSAVFWANEIRVPILIGHGGEAGWQVPPHHAIAMAEALERYGLPHRLILYPDADHFFAGTDFLYEVDEWFALHPIKE